MSLQKKVKEFWNDLSIDAKSTITVLGLMAVGATTLVIYAQEPNPTKPVVAIDRAQFADFKRDHNVSKAITSVIACPPGTPKAVYNRILNRAIEVDANLVVLDVHYQADVEGRECYKGVAYWFS